MSTSGKEVEQGIVMTCPSKCTKQTIIPDGDIQKLPKNFALMDVVHSRQLERSVSRATVMTTTGDYVCDVCENSKAEVACPSCDVSLCLLCSNEIHQKKGYQVHRLVPLSDILNGTVDDLPSDGMVNQRSFSDPEIDPDKPKMCTVHPSELSEYLCITCSEEVCKQCHLVDSHKGHDCKLIKDIVQEKKDSLRLLLSTVQEKHTLWNKGFDRCQELREYATARRSELEGVIKTHFEEIYSTLRGREEKILRDLQEEMLSRDQLLSSQGE